MTSLDVLKEDSGSHDEQHQAQPPGSNRRAVMQQASSSMSGLDDSKNYRRKSLPVFAMGARQHGIRGGTIAECAQEALLDASRREEEEEELKQRALQERCNPLKAPLRRTKTAPEPRRTIVVREEEQDEMKDWWKDPPGADTDKKIGFTVE